MTEPERKLVQVDRVGRTAIVTIDRPEARNALTRAVILALREAFDEASSDPNVRCVVLTGAGGHFCAGADLRRSFVEDPSLMDNLERYMDEYHAVIKAIVQCAKPSIAMVDGAAVGFGADLALACDLRVVSTTAYVQEKFVKIGLMPDGGGTFWLPRLVGTARAMELMLLGDKLEAAEMKALGVATQVAAPSELHAATLALAMKIEAGPPLAFAEIRRSVYASWGDVEDALRREREGQLRLLRSADAMEGIMAWTQKRDPTFQGA